MSDDHEPLSWKATLERGAKIHYQTKYDPTPRVGTVITELKCIAGLDWVYHVQVDDEARNIVYVRPEYITARWQPPPPYSPTASSSGSRSQQGIQRSESHTQRPWGQTRPASEEEQRRVSHPIQPAQAGPLRPPVHQPPPPRWESQISERPEIPHASRPVEQPSGSSSTTQRGYSYRPAGFSHEPPMTLGREAASWRQESSRQAVVSPPATQSFSSSRTPSASYTSSSQGQEPRLANRQSQASTSSMPTWGEPSRGRSDTPSEARYQPGDRVMIEIPGGSWTYGIVRSVLWGLSRFGGFAYDVRWDAARAPEIIREEAVRPAKED